MPGKYALYKNKSSMRVNLISPKYNDKGYVDSEGALLVEMADCTGQSADGNNVYNWEQKIMFALGIADIALLMENPWAALTHVHEKGGVETTKVVKFQKLDPR